MNNREIKETGFALMSFEMFGHSNPNNVPPERLKEFFSAMRSFATAYHNGFGLRWLENYSKIIFLDDGKTDLKKVPNNFSLYSQMFKVAVSQYRKGVKNSHEYWEGINRLTNDRSFKRVNNWGEYCNEAFNYFSK